jgi:NAD(P)-dependent dehydrogenase (short-subunit alcohol dehydrogenase family)
MRAGMTGRQVVVVTGASAGIGRAVARRFAGPDVDIALLARTREGLEGARREVEAAGSRALAVPVDIADHAAVDAAAAQVEETFGPIDVWVNNAMVTVFGFFDDVEPEEFRRATEVTYLGAVWGTRAALRRMLPRDSGTIVLVGSALAYRGIPLQAPYCGAKHAMKGFFESLRCELRNRGSRIHLTMVQLPGLNTPQFDHCRNKLAKRSRPVPPVFQPEVAADAIHWAARHRRAELVVGGPTVMTIWGNKLGPWVAERYLARTAVKAQQTEDPKPPDAPDNLFDAVPGDPGAHGRFDAEGKRQSRQLWFTTHRAMLAAGALAGAGTALAAAARGRR